MGDLDGGSAAPATPDVPAENPGVHPALACPSILDPNDYWVPAGCACVLTRSRGWAPIDVDDSACPIHSGVAGERSDSQIDSETGPTLVPAPTPADPSAALTTGCVAVSDEAVEVFQLAYSEADGRRRVRAGLEAAAPLIAAQALRQAAEDIRGELVCCDAYQRAHGDQRAIEQVEDRGHAICFWGEAAARITDGRADELERGGDHA